MDYITFDPIAPVYDATRVFDQSCFNAALDYIVERFPPSRYPSLFEPGIGTGRIALPLAAKGYRVTGADVSEEMLKVLAAKLEKSQTPLPVTFILQDITSLPFPDASFDIAVGVHIYHLIRNWKKAMDETFRVLKPGAPLILMFTGVCLEVPHVRERYRELCAESGYPAQHLGLNSSRDLPGYLGPAGRRIEWIRGRWPWRQSIRVDRALEDIGKKFYSTSQHVPDKVHRKVMQQLTAELRQRYPDLAVAEEVPTSIDVGIILPA